MQLVLAGEKELSLLAQACLLAAPIDHSPESHGAEEEKTLENKTEARECLAIKERYS